MKITQNPVKFYGYADFVKKLSIPTVIFFVYGKNADLIRLIPADVIHCTERSGPADKAHPQ